MKKILLILALTFLNNFVLFADGNGGPSCKANVYVKIEGCTQSTDSANGDIQYLSFDCPTLQNTIIVTPSMYNENCSFDLHVWLEYSNVTLLTIDEDSTYIANYNTTLIGKFKAEGHGLPRNVQNFNLRVAQDSINPQTIIINGGENFTYDTIFRFIRPENSNQPVVLKTNNSDLKFFTMTKKYNQFYRKSMDSLVFNEPGIYPFSYQSETEVFYSSIEIKNYTPVIKKPDFILHPNPVSDILNVSVNSVFDYEIYNLSGKIMMKQNGASSAINVKNLPKGIYIIQINTNGNIIKEKFMKS